MLWVGVRVITKFRALLQCVIFNTKTTGLSKLTINQPMNEIYVIIMSHWSILLLKENEQQ